MDMVLQAEMLDKVEYPDGWSVQADREKMADGSIRIMLYCFHEEEPGGLDDYMHEDECHSIQEAYGLFDLFLRVCQLKYDGYPPMA